MASPNTNPQEQARIANMLARNAITQSAVKQILPVANASIPLTGGALSQTAVQLQPTPVGFQLGFWLGIKANITNTSGGVLTRTPFGGSNLLQNATYFDLGNTPRTNASGKMLEMLMTQKQGQPFGATVTPDESYGVGFGNWDIYKVPATIASAATADVKFWFYIPLAYSDFDLRGAVFGNIAQAMQRLNLTFPTSAQMIASNVESPVDAVYQSASATKTITINSWSYEVYLHTYGAGLPMRDGQYIAPLNDLGTVYALNETSVTGLTVGQQLSVPFPNSWEYISLTSVFANGNQQNAGTDVTDIETKTASGISWGALTPDIHALTTSLRIKAHPPAGMYFDSYHQKSVKVAEYGAMTWNLRPKVVNTGANVRIAYEFFDTLANYSATGLTM